MYVSRRTEFNNRPNSSPLLFLNLCWIARHGRDLLLDNGCPDSRENNRLPGLIDHSMEKPIIKKGMWVSFAGFECCVSFVPTSGGYPLMVWLHPFLRKQSTARDARLSALKDSWPDLSHVPRIQIARKYWKERKTTKDIQSIPDAILCISYEVKTQSEFHSSEITSLVIALESQQGDAFLRFVAS